MSKARFWILLGGRLLFVSTEPDQSLIEFFRGLRNDVDAAKLFPAKLSYADCKFYLLRNPPSVRVDRNQRNQPKDNQGYPLAVTQACLEETNRELVAPGTIEVSQLANEISRHCVYLAIDFPDPFGQSDQAIQRLRQEHNELFKSLQVTVEKYNFWNPRDVARNLQGGIHTSDVTTLPPEFRKVQEALGKKRLYRPDDNQTRDCQNARSYRIEFDRIFASAGAESNTVLSDREFAAFYNVLRCYHSDALKIKDVDAPSLKASNFSVHFIQPTFFSGHDDSLDFKFQQEKSWEFPIFVETTQAPNFWRKFTPRSDWKVISPSHGIPFVISEVISQKNESDRRCRMLVQAIALARAGQFLLQSTSNQNFFVVAVYVNAAMVVSRYIVMQSGRDNSSSNEENDLLRDKTVCIHQKDFDLTNKDDEIDFLREMYNLTTEIAALSGDLDQLKQGILKIINNIAVKVLSISSPTRQTKITGPAFMESIPEESEQPSGGERQEDDLGVFNSQDIQSILRQMNYEIEFIPFGHPHLAVIVNKTGDKNGCLKFVEGEREVNVLRYLTQIDSPSNHTISGVQFWPVQGGTVISMPIVGGWLTSLENPNKQLWSVALQLFEAVEFMHDHNVAHMDLKPQNIVIPSAGGRLSIIDFSVSIRVPGPDAKYAGAVGTEAYMAPEVRKGQYKPMLADLWSCGRTLEELCSRCNHSVERTKLLEIARQLMDREPAARPRISTVLKWVAPQQGEASSALGFFSAVSPLCA